MSLYEMLNFTALSIKDSRRKQYMEVKGRQHQPARLNVPLKEIKMNAKLNFMVCALCPMLIMPCHQGEEVYKRTHNADRSN